MSRLTKYLLEKEDSILKSEIESANSINKSLNLIQLNAYMQWMYPYNKSYTDNFLEQKLSKITVKRFVDEQNNSQLAADIFIASFLLDNGGLFQQYIEGINKNANNLVVIVTNKLDKAKAKETLKLIEQNNIKIYIVDQQNTYQKSVKIASVINSFIPVRIWAHLVPSDVPALVSTLSYRCKKFFIVGNDHTFWLGKNFFDYFIEFRQHGISLAIERRGISRDKILHIPYYPIRNNKSFKGFPFVRKDKIVGISGANLYKYFVDPELKYFQIIKELLDENPDFIFCLTGWGDVKRIQNFIQDNGLEDRFFFLGRRDDFYSLIGQCDILFESYPLKGGLVPLFATEQKIPVVGIATYDNFSGSLEELLDIEDYKQPTNFSEFKDEATRLIRDSDYRNHLGYLLSKNRCNKRDFDNAIMKILNDDFESLKPKSIKPLKLNDDAYLQEYLNLPDATYENLMRQKLFIMKSSLPLFKRLKILFPALKASNTKGVRGFIRIFILVILGK